jgi:hypothetical protein
MGKPKNFSNPLIITILLGILPRIAFLPHTMTDDGDAVTRLMIAEDWLHNPHIISNGTWGPLHFYLLSAILGLTGDRIVAPAVINILFSTLGGLALFYFSKREFGDRAGLFALLCYLLYPPAIRNSFVALSQPPFLFFILLGLFFLSKARANINQARNSAFSGLCLTISAGIRFESWVLIPLYAIFLKRFPKSALIFLSVGALFPLYWVISCYITTGDPLSSAHGSAEWELIHEGRNQHLSPEILLQRAVTNPSITLWGLTPLLSLATLVGTYRAFREKLPQRVWSFPALILWIVLLINTINGSLSWRPAYSLTLGVLLLPFAELSMNLLPDKIRRFARIGVLLSMVPLSFLIDDQRFISYPISPIPQLDNHLLEIRDKINSNMRLNENLALDFLGWAESYYLALHSNIPFSQVFVTSGAKNYSIDGNRLFEFLCSRSQSGILVVQPHNGRLYDEIEKMPQLAPKIILETKEIGRFAAKQNSYILVLRYSADCQSNP